MKNRIKNLILSFFIRALLQITKFSLKKSPLKIRALYFGKNYLFDQVGAFLAFFKPGFFLSLTLGSLLSKPCGFKESLSSEFQSINALAKASLIASDCPAIPPPTILISASNFVATSFPSVVKGASAF